MNNKIIRMGLCVFVCMISFACSSGGGSSKTSSSSSSVGQIDALPGVRAEDLGEYQGAIGLAFSTRDIVKKGHVISQLNIQLESNTGIEGGTVEVHSDLNIGRLSYDASALTDEQKQELEDGVPVNVTLLDADENVLAQQNYDILSFKSNPTNREIDSDNFEDQYAKLSLRSDIPYYLQLKTDQSTLFGAPDSSNYEDATDAATKRPLRILRSLDYAEASTTEYTKFWFDVIDEDNEIYSISVRDGEKRFYLYINPTNNHLNVQTERNYFLNEENTDPSELLNYQFEIVKEDQGIYKILSVITGDAVVLTNEDTALASVEPTDFTRPVFFRIFSLDIDWEIEQLGAIFIEPILPPVDTSFGFNSTLRNCGSGALNQEVGVELSSTVSTTVGWEESFKLSSSSTHTETVTIGATIDAPFFGGGVSVSAEHEDTQSFTSSATSTSSNFGESTVEKTETYFSSRVVTVPAGKASQVYDAYQFYKNIKIPFVKRFRVSGSYLEDSVRLTGDEVVTQFVFNNFNGVFTKVEPTYVEITVRGFNTLENYGKTESNVEDVPANCN